MLMRAGYLKSGLMMEAPVPYGSFHAAMIGVAVVFALGAWRLRGMNESRRQKLLFCLGVLLASGEVLKQLFRFLIVDQGVYNWWYFPFQLCSMPMYLCLLLPLLKKRRKTIITFLANYALLGGIAVYLDPSDMMSRYVFLTLFSFLWHDLLIVIGILCGTSAAMEDDVWGAVKMLGLLAGLTGIAEILNLVLSRYGELSMFYLSPKLANTQLVFREIARLWGIPAGNFCYFLAMIAGGLIIHGLWRRIRRKQTSNPAA